MNSIFVKKIFLVLLIISIFICTYNCSSKNLSLDQLNLVDNSFREAEGLLYQNFDEIPENINILVDITGSMKGFSRAGDVLKTFFMDINASFDPDRINYYSFSNVMKNESSYDIFTKPSKYTAESTNYHLLQKYVLNEGITVLITDLQFNKDSYQDTLTKIIKNHISKGTFVKILGSKLEFDGKYYPRGGDKNLDYRGERPVYAIIFSENKYSTYLHDALRNSRNWHETLNLNSYTIAEIMNNWMPNENKGEYKRSTYDLSAISYDKIGSYQIYNFKDNVINSSLIVKNPTLREYKDINKNNVRITYFEIPSTKIDSSTRFIEKSNTGFEAIAYCESIEFNDQIGGHIVNVSFHKLQSNTNYIFLLNITPTVPPKWIYEWSVDSRENPNDQSNHTLYLTRIIRDLYLSVSNPYVPTYAILYVSTVK